MHWISTIATNIWAGGGSSKNLTAGSGVWLCVVVNGLLSEYTGVTSHEIQLYMDTRPQVFIINITPLTNFYFYVRGAHFSRPLQR
jgi:hypothetical protein